MDDVRNERPTYIGIESPFFFNRLLRATKGTGHCGSDVQFYAKYPAELFDELVHALVQLYEPGVAPRGDAKFLPFDSVLICSRSWWRVFKSLQPSCPLNIDVFVRFSDAWWGVLWPGGGVQPNAEHRAVRRELAGEVELLEQWLTATGMHEERPSKMAAANAPKADETTPAKVHNSSAAIDPKADERSLGMTAHSEQDDEKPTWLVDDRKLSFNGQVARQFSPQTGKEVLNIISTFEECDWPNRIDDPLSPPDAEKTKLALRTINLGLCGMRFIKDGDGIKWEVIPNSL